MYIYRVTIEPFTGGLYMGTLNILVVGGVVFVVIVVTVCSVVDELLVVPHRVLWCALLVLLPFSP